MSASSESRTAGTAGGGSGDGASPAPERSARERPQLTLRGIAAAPGIAIGPVELVADDPPLPGGTLPEEAVEEELGRFQRAIERSREEVGFLRATCAEELGEESAAIFDAQLLFLEDAVVIGPVIEAVRRERKPVATAFDEHVGGLLKQLEVTDNEYLRQRAEDIRGIKRRLLHHLLGASDSSRPPAAAEGILVGREIDPADAARLDRARYSGFAVEQGGMTSHAVIMARGKGVPAVVGVRGLMRQARAGDLAVVDGLAGTVVLNPSPPVLAEAERRRDEYRAFESSLAGLRDEPACTTDGRLIELSANLEFPGDLPRVLENGAAGIGLYRTEFFYIDRARMPDEEEQYQAYRQVVEGMSPRPVTIRTMDLGGDKVASYLGTGLGTGRESNPFLGWRGIRFSLDHREAFRTQLRAIYRAAHGGRVRIMLPMITAIEELRASRALAAQVLTELDAEGTPRGSGVEFGIMVETPSAVLIADILAREVDFFSVGTNDLIQYTLAADRTNPKTAALYQPLHPAILRSLRNVVDAARAERIKVSVCGEMAGDPLAVVVLVGLGVDALSVSPMLVPEVKTVVRSIAFREAQLVANEALALDSWGAVRALVLHRMAGRLPRFLLP